MTNTIGRRSRVCDFSVVYEMSPLTSLLKQDTRRESYPADAEAALPVADIFLATWREAATCFSHLLAVSPATIFMRQSQPGCAYTIPSAHGTFSHSTVAGMRITPGLISFTASHLSQRARISDLGPG